MKCDEAKHSFPWNPFIHEKVSCLKSAKGSIDDIFSALTLLHPKHLQLSTLSRLFTDTSIRSCGLKTRRSIRRE